MQELVHILEGEGGRAMGEAIVILHFILRQQGSLGVIEDITDRLLLHLFQFGKQVDDKSMYFY